MKKCLKTLDRFRFRYSPAPGSRYEDTARLSVFEGGAESNVAYAVARMGHRATWFSALPDEPRGHRFASTLTLTGVDTSTVVWSEEGRMGVYYVELGSAPRTGRVIYDRTQSCASGLAVDDVPWDQVRSADVIHLTGITPALSESLAEAASEVIRVGRSERCYVTFDLNYRAQLWGDRDPTTALLPLARSSDMVILGLDDARDVFGLTGSPDDVVSSLHTLIGAPSLILTLGHQGSIWTIDGSEGETPALATSVIDPIGAGDAFAAGVIVGLLDGDVAQGVELGTAMAALTMSWSGDRFHGDRRVVEGVLAGRLRQFDR